MSQFNGHGAAHFDGFDPDAWRHEMEHGHDPRGSTSPAIEPVKLTFAADVVFSPRVSAPLKGVIELGDVGAIYGPSSVGKTFVVIDLAVAIAKGLSHWAGKRIKPGAVLYVYFEGGRGLNNRLLAARIMRGDPGRRLGLYEATEPLNKNGGTTGVDRIVAAAEALAIEADDEVTLIVIDTLSAATAGDDENSAGDMALFMDKNKAIARKTGAAVCVIHHTGKDTSKGMRGSAAIRGNVDFVLEIEDGGVINVDKSRDGVKGPLASFELEQVEIGTDDDADKVTSCVVRWKDGVPKELRKGPKLSPAAKRALDMIQRLYADGKAFDVDPAAIDVAGTATDRMPRVVTLEAWREKCTAAKLSKDGKPDAERMAFNRAVDALEGAGRVARYGDHAWLLGQKRNAGGQP